MLFMFIHNRQPDVTKLQREENLRDAIRKITDNVDPIEAVGGYVGSDGFSLKPPFVYRYSILDGTVLLSHTSWDEVNRAPTPYVPQSITDIAYTNGSGLDLMIAHTPMPNGDELCEHLELGGLMPGKKAQRLSEAVIEFAQQFPDQDVII
jgi:hypothetical protein